MLRDVEGDLLRARNLVANATSIVAVTGAGISTDSGIPDFRGPEGVWTKDPSAEMLSDYDTWIAEPSIRVAAWQSRLSSPYWKAVPNDGHRALVALGERGSLRAIITQNIDRLHHAAGSDPTTVIEIHGNGHEYVCLRCGDTGAIDVILDRVRAGELDPTCDRVVDDQRCGGIIKSATISFGQSLVPADLARAEAVARRADLVLAVGSTLSVYPAAGVVPLAKANGAAVIIVNGSPTAMDDLADIVLRGDISRTLATLVGEEGAD